MNKRPGPRFFLDFFWLPGTRFSANSQPERGKGTLETV